MNQVFTIKIGADGRVDLEGVAGMDKKTHLQFVAVWAAIEMYFKEHPQQITNPYAYEVALDTPKARQIFAAVGTDFRVVIERPPINIPASALPPIPQIHIRVKNGHYEADIGGQPVPVRVVPYDEKRG